VQSLRLDALDIGHATAHQAAALWSTLATLPDLRAGRGFGDGGWAAAHLFLPGLVTIDQNQVILIPPGMQYNRQLALFRGKYCQS